MDLQTSPILNFFNDTNFNNLVFWIPSHSAEVIELKLYGGDLGGTAVRPPARCMRPQSVQVHVREWNLRLVVKGVQ